MGRLEEIIPEISWPESIRQTATAFGPLRKRQSQTVLALRVYVLHWVLDGLLRMHGAHRTPPPIADRETTYQNAFEIVNKNTPAEWRALLRDLVCHLSPDAPGVRALVHLLIGLEILNAECRRRFAHRTTRRRVKAWQRGETDAEKTLFDLTRKWSVKGKKLEKWFPPPGFPTPPARKDSDSARAAAWAEHDDRCLEALRDVVAAYDSAVEDTTAGRVTIPTLPDGPFAALYPVRRPWWKPIAARLCAENIQASLAALYAETDDTIETYPLKAFDRLKTHHEEHEDGRLPLKDAVSLGARLRTGVKKGVPYRSQSETRLGKVRLEVERVTATTTPEPDAPPPAPPDFAEQLETLVIKEKKWGRRMWKALCLKIEDPRTSWETVAKAAGVRKTEMLDRRKILKAWRHAYLTAWRREQQRE